jgi:hypothetical protein
VRARVFDGGDGEGSLSAGGNAYDYIFTARRFFVAIGCGRAHGNLRSASTAARQRLGAARDDELNDAWIDVKRGRTFDRIEGGDPSAGAGADIDEATALASAGGDPGRPLAQSAQRALFTAAATLASSTLMMRAIWSADLLSRPAEADIRFLGAEALKFHSRFASVFPSRLHPQQFLVSAFRIRASLRACRKCRAADAPSGAGSGG